MTSHYGWTGAGGLVNDGRTGIGKNERVKGIDDGPDCPQRAAFIREVLERYKLRERTIAPSPLVAQPAQRRRHNDMSDPSVPLKARPVDVHVNGSPEVACVVCGKTVERVHCNQVTCGADKCKNRRNRERQKARPITINPAELLEIARAKGVVR